MSPGTSPIVPVADVARSVAFYRDRLGFSPVIGNPEHGFAMMEREGLKISLIHAADEAALRATANNISAQLWVEDLDALWAEIEPQKDAFPGGTLKPPFDREYGVRELHIKDPDGFLMFFTQIDREEP